MTTRKTNIEIDARLFERLLSIAGRLKVPPEDLLLEGLEHVLARYAAQEDAAQLSVRLEEARQRMRAGYFDGPLDSTP